MHVHARTFMFAGAACLGLYGAAFAYSPADIDDARMTGVLTENIGAFGYTSGHHAFAAAQRIRCNDAIWPVQGGDIVVPYGPGHASIEIAVAANENVLAAADGEVYAAYAAHDKANPYPDAGAVVVLRHTSDVDLRTAEGTTRRYYTIYAGLDMNFVSTPAEGKNAQIGKGAVIGITGERPLHVEMRLGAPNGPAMHPLRLLPYGDIDSLEAEIVALDPLTVRMTTDVQEPDITEVRVKVGEEIRAYDIAALPDDIIATVDTYDARGDRYGLSLTFTDIMRPENILIRDVWGKGVRLIP